jgi:hypothetical protein
MEHIERVFFSAMISTAWAKLSQTTNATERRWYSLIAHATDVAAVLEALATVPTIRGRLAAAAEQDISPTNVERLWLAFLHGLAKQTLGSGADNFRRTKHGAATMSDTLGTFGRHHLYFATNRSHLSPRMPFSLT